MIRKYVQKHHIDRMRAMEFTPEESIALMRMVLARTVVNPPAESRPQTYKITANGVTWTVPAVEFT